VSMEDCVFGCQARDHDRLGHEQFLLVTRSMNLTRAEQEMMLNGWERAWVNRASALDVLLGALQEAVDSLDATINYQGEAGWKERFLERHGLHLDGQRVMMSQGE
jgi:hypothetical protein